MACLSDPQQSFGNPLRAMFTKIEILSAVSGEIILSITTTTTQLYLYATFYNYNKQYKLRKIWKST